VKRLLPLLLAVAAAAGVTATAPATAAPRGDGLGHCTGSVCSFDVPPGTYRLTLVLGSRTAAADTGVEVEARRTVVAPVATRAGRTVTRTVDVDVRTPESMPDGQEGDGTPGLQVYLTGGAPALTSIQVTPAPGVRRLFVVSDSTAADWLYGPKRGWAQELPQLLGPGTAVANWGDSGSSTVSWLSNPALFAALETHIRPGDEVMVQLAHNDKTTPEATYRANLEAIVAGIRAHGGRPVLVTPPCRHLFAADGTITPTGRIVNNLGVDLPAVMRDEAAKLGVPLLDLTAATQALLEKLGPDASWSLYVPYPGTGTRDATHFSPSGATEIAGLVLRLAERQGLLP
jgi:lysophospholipase L1-like esterase